MRDRVYNVEKGRKRKAEVNLEEDETPRKRGRPKRTINLESRYPKLTGSLDNTGDQQKERSIELEMEKDRPRKDIVLPLMKQTFYTRRRYLLHNDGSVVSKLTKYPALKMPPVVCIQAHSTV